MDKTLDPTDDPADAETRLKMPLVEAMLTQRAVRRVQADPVDDRIVLRCLELALEAPTGSNGQNWEFVVVKDHAVKASLAAQYRRAWRLYGGLGRRLRTDEQTSRILKSVQWQVEHFEQIPVLVVCCLRGGARVPFVPEPPVAVSSHYGSIYPSVQNLLLRGESRRPRWCAHHPAAVVEHPRSPHPRAAPQRRAVLHRHARLAEGTLRSQGSQADRHGGPPRPLRLPALERRPTGMKLGRLRHLGPVTWATGPKPLSQASNWVCPSRGGTRLRLCGADC